MRFIRKLFVASRRAFPERNGGAFALSLAGALLFVAAFAAALVSAPPPALAETKAASAGASASMEDYKNLSAEYKQKQTEEKALAASCPDPKAPCALTLMEMRAMQEDREKKLVRMEKSLKIDTAERKGEKENKQEQEQEQEKSQAQKTQESAVKKINKQQKFLKITALINAGVGGYLLLNHCSPPAQKFGCVLGPLALGQALISYSQAGKLQKTASQLSGISFDSKEEEEGEKEGEEREGEERREVLQFNKKPVTETQFPCPEGTGGGGPCVLSKDGKTIQSIKGGKTVGISEFAGMTRLDPVERKAAAKALRKALKKQKKLLAEAKEMEPEHDPVAGWSAAALGGAGGGGGGFGGGGGGGGGGAASDSIAGGGGASSAGGGKRSKGEASFSGNSPAGGKERYGFAPAPSGDGEGGEGFYDEWAEEELEAEEEGDEDEELNEEIENILGRFSSPGDEEKKTGKEKPALSYGKNESIAPSSDNMFSIIRNRYQAFRKQRKLVGKVKRKPLDNK